MYKKTPLLVILLLAIISSIAQAQSICRVQATALDPAQQPKANFVVEVVQIVAPNQIFPNLRQTFRTNSGGVLMGADGIAGIPLPQGATVWFYAAMPGLNSDPRNGTALSIPNTATAQLLDLARLAGVITALGDLPYGGQYGVPTRLPGNTSTTPKLLTQKGTGTVSAAPDWWSLVAGAGVTVTPDATGKTFTINATTNGGTLTQINTGNGLSGGPITGTGTVDLRLNASGGLSKTLGAGSNELGLTDTGVLAGTYTSTSIVVDSKGRITAIGNGVGGTNITFREADGTPSILPSTVEFQQANGFIWTDQGSGVGRLSLSAVPLSKLAALTANRALVTDGSGVVVATSVTDTELGYVGGVTSAVQTQINGKADTGHTHTFASLTSKPTTLSGYSIADAQPLNTDLTSIAALTSTNDDVIQRKAGVWTNRSIAQLKNDFGLAAIATSGSASDMGSGTVPDARFPATLPAASGVNLTALNASNLGSGTVPLGRISGLTNTQLSGSAGITYANLQTVSATNRLLGRSTAGAGVIEEITPTNSVVLSGGNLALSGDSGSPGNSKYYGTDSGGTKGYFSLPSNSPPFADNAAIVKNNSDNTKLLILDASLITPGTTRTLKAQDGNYSVAGINFANTFSSAQSFSSTIAQTASNAAAFASGPNGNTGPALRIVTDVASAASGISITGRADGTAPTLASIARTQGASTLAGNGIAIVADDAVAGTTNAGAAAGGDVNITPGNAARFTSGNAANGKVNITLKTTGIGTGAGGAVVIGNAGGVHTLLLNTDNSGTTASYNGRIAIEWRFAGGLRSFILGAQGGGNDLVFGTSTEQMRLISGTGLALASGNAIGLNSSSSPLPVSLLALHRLLKLPTARQVWVIF